MLFFNKHLIRYGGIMVLRFRERITNRTIEITFEIKLVREWGTGVINHDGPSRPQIRTYALREIDGKPQKTWLDFVGYKRYSTWWAHGTKEGQEANYFTLKEPSEQGYMFNIATYVWNPDYFEVFILQDDGTLYEELR